MNNFLNGRNFLPIISGKNWREFFNIFKHLSPTNIFKFNVSPLVLCIKQKMDETKNEKVFDGGDKENNINRKNINLEKEKKDTGSINNNNHNNNLSEISEDTVTDNDSYVTFLTQGNNIGSFYKRKNHKPLPPKLALSFSGAGFLGIYHFGVIHCLQAYAPTLVSKVQRYAGTSAGSIIASLLAISPEIFNKSMKLLIQMADETNTLAFGALTNGFSMHEKLVRAVDEVIPDNVSSLKDRLYISMTNAKVI